MSAVRHVLPDASAAAGACAQRILALLRDAEEKRQTAALAISGGSTPKLLFDRLSASGLPWSRVHLFWVDERCVPPTDDASNYKLALERLITPAGIPESNVHRIHGEIDPQEAARRYAAEIRSFFELGSTEFPRFDAVHLGMGPDAHTASLFPGQPLIEDREGIAAAVFAPQFDQWRVTLLPGVLQAARAAVFLVAGEDKRPALHAVLEGERDPGKYPAQIVGSRAEWFLDSAAGG